MNSFDRLVALAALMAVTACEAPPPPGPVPLAPLGAKIDETSVSGISSGAYMAGQFQFAHGRLVVGAAIIAGGPYGCAESLYSDLFGGPGAAFMNVSKAVSGCMQNAMAIWGVPNPSLLADKARKRAEQERIDPIDSVTSDRVYLFSGQQDRTVVPAIVEAAADFYKRIGVPEENIKFEAALPAGHAFITEDKGLACGLSEKPYVVDCDYDQAGALLKHIYGALQPRSQIAGGDYIAFDQKAFIEDLGDTGMADEGIVYVPKACAAMAKCRVHIAFHGCAQNRPSVGDAFARDTGFARWADTNRLIVLFPQIEASALENPQGCWDWWGYTGSAFLTRDALQIQAVHRMLQKLGQTASG